MKGSDSRFGTSINSKAWGEVVAFILSLCILKECTLTDAEACRTRG